MLRSGNFCRQSEQRCCRPPVRSSRRALANTPGADTFRTCRRLFSNMQEREQQEGQIRAAPAPQATDPPGPRLSDVQCKQPVPSRTKPKGRGDVGIRGARRALRRLSAASARFAAIDRPPPSSASGEQQDRQHDARVSAEKKTSAKVERLHRPAPWDAE